MNLFDSYFILANFLPFDILRFLVRYSAVLFLPSQILVNSFQICRCLTVESECRGGGGRTGTFFGLFAVFLKVGQGQ